MLFYRVLNFYELVIFSEYLFTLIRKSKKYKKLRPKTKKKLTKRLKKKNQIEEFFKKHYYILFLKKMITYNFFYFSGQDE